MFSSVDAWWKHSHNLFAREVSNSTANGYLAETIFLHGKPSFLLVIGAHSNILRYFSTRGLGGWLTGALPGQAHVLMVQSWLDAQEWLESMLNKNPACYPAHKISLKSITTVFRKLISLLVSLYPGKLFSKT
ncbi:hypothetical protein CEXT_117811 [Caerostris extrusa]|uniref:Uncharacterized protein n=1 Tax=Caerostris extrusa TaxID=172846 RepID=A0AAV4UYU4_CAEEX|nr:hypothetical protein CEXT_117811 [Caerostris extrusa]